MAGSAWLWFICSLKTVLLLCEFLEIHRCHSLDRPGGKGVRTAPRDALVADTVQPDQRGMAFGLHRAADTAGAMLGILIAALLVWRLQATDTSFQQKTFQTIVLVSVIPAFWLCSPWLLAQKETKKGNARELPKITFRGLGKNFLIFLVIVGIFDLGNSSTPSWCCARRSGA